MPITIKHGYGMDALGMAYAPQAAEAYNRAMIRKQKKEEKKAKKKQAWNTAIMAGAGVAAVAAPVLAPVMFAGKAAAVGSTAYEGAVASGASKEFATIAGQAAKQQYLSNASLAMSTGINALGTAYQAFTPAEEQSAAGNALFAAGSGFGGMLNQQQQRQTDINTNMANNMALMGFRSDLQFDNWKRVEMEKSNMDVERIIGLHKDVSELQDKLTQPEYADAQTQRELRATLDAKQAYLNRLEYSKTYQPSMNGLPVSVNTKWAVHQRLMNEYSQVAAKGAFAPGQEEYMLGQVDNVERSVVDELKLLGTEEQHQQATNAARTLAMEDLRPEYESGKRWYWWDKSYDEWLQVPENQVKLERAMRRRFLLATGLY